MMPRFMLEGPRLCSIFCFALILIHYVKFTQPKFFYRFGPQSEVEATIVFCAQPWQKK